MSMPVAMLPTAATPETNPAPGATGPGVEWTWYPWARLPAQVLHDLLKLRSDVFIIEQACAYDDIDGRDPRCEHLVATGPTLAGGPLETLVCLRLLPPGTKYAEGSLGRLATHAHARHRGLARAAVARGLERLAATHPAAGVRISGQRYLQAFYESFGFAPVDEPYDEDGIPHQDLVLTPAQLAAFGPDRGAVSPPSAAPRELPA